MTAKKKRFKFKITDDTLTTIVIDSLLFCAAVTIAGLVLGAFDHDVSAVVDSTHRIFGTELGVCGLLKVHDRTIEKSEKRAAQRREREAQHDAELRKEYEEMGGLAYA